MPPLRGNGKSRVRKYLSSLPGTDPLTNRQTHLTTHRHTHKTHLTLQRKANNTSRAESINTARTLFYGSEHEYIEPSCGRRKYCYRHVLGGMRRLSSSSSFGDFDCLQFEFDFDFDSCCTVTDSEERVCRPLPRRRAQTRAVRPEPINIFELPDELQFWDDATLSLTPTSPNSNENEPDLTNLLNVLSANDIYDALNSDNDNDMDFGRLFLLPNANDKANTNANANANLPSSSDSPFDFEQIHPIMSLRAPHNVNAHPQTPKKKNTPRFTPMAPKRGNKVIKIRSQVSKVDKIGKVDKISGISKIGKISESKIKSTIKSTSKSKSKSKSILGNTNENENENGSMHIDPLADAGYGYEVPEHLILHIPFLTTTSTPVPSLVPSESNPIPIRIPSSGIPSPTPTPPHNVSDITTTHIPNPIPECPLTSDISRLNLNLDTNSSESIPLNAFSGPSFTLSPIDIFASSNRDRDASINALSGPSFTLPSSSSSCSDDIDMFMCSPPPPPHYIDSPQTQTAPCDYNAFSTSCLTLPPSSLGNTQIPTDIPPAPFNAFSTPCFTLPSPSFSTNNYPHTYNTMTSSPAPSPPFNAFSTPCFTLPSPSPFSTNNQPHTYNAMTSSPAPPPFNAFSTPCFTLPSPSSSSSNNTQIAIDIPSAPFNAFSTPCFTLPPPSPSSLSFSTNNHSLQTYDHQTQASTGIIAPSTTPVPYNVFSGPSFTLPSSSFSSSSSSSSFSSNTNTSHRTVDPTNTNTNTNTNAHRYRTHVPIPISTSTTPVPRAPRAYTSHTQTQTQTSRLQRPTRFSDRHHPYHSKDTTHKDNKDTDTDKDVEMSDSITTTTTHTTTLRRPVALTRTAKRDSAAVPPFIRDMYDRNRNRRSKEGERLTQSFKLGTQVGFDTDMVMDEFRVGPNLITQGHTDDLDVIMDEPDPSPYQYAPTPTPTYGHPSLLPRESPIARLYSDEDSIGKGQMFTSNFYNW